MSNLSEQQSILCLHTEKVGSKTLSLLRDFFGSYTAVLTAIQHGKAGKVLKQEQIDSIVKRQALVPKIEELIERLGVSVVIQGEEGYPVLLSEIADPPAVLYVRGYLPTGRSIAIVGSRKYTTYGKSLTSDIAKNAVQYGASVVSGLALGIDATAHIAALQQKGKTVGVLACGIEQIYPASHRALAEAMIKNGGAVVTEFPFFTPPYRGNFLVRNRIIAGLSHATVVVEAALGSGSLVTARLALDYNRDVFALPGDVHRETSQGPNELLACGAMLITNGKEFADYFGVKPEQTVKEVSLDEEERRITMQIAKDGTHIDVLCESLNLDIGTLSSKVIMLEIKGAIKNEGAGLYRRLI